MAKQSLGRVSILFKGTYDSLTTYNKLDIVEYQGSSYECKNNNTVGIIPTNTTYWNLVAQKGATGDTPDISGKLDTSKVKSSYSTTAGDVYDVTYINITVGSIETLLSGI